MVWLPWNEQQICRLNLRPQMWPSGLTLAMSFTLNFQGQIWNLLYLNQKRSDYHESKSKHIEWTPGLKCHQLVWPCNDLDLWIFKAECDLDLWPYTWCCPRIFMVKFEIVVSQNGKADWHKCVSGVFFLHFCYLVVVKISHNIPNCMKEVTWLMLCLSTNGHRSVGLGWRPFI